MREFSLSKVDSKLKYINDNLVNGKKFLVGDKFSIADSYLYIVLTWEPYAKFDTKPYPNVQKYFEGIKALPLVQAAHKAMEGVPTTTANPEK